MTEDSAHSNSCELKDLPAFAFELASGSPFQVSIYLREDSQILVSSGWLVHLEDVTSPNTKSNNSS